MSTKAKIKLAAKKKWPVVAIITGIAGMLVGTGLAVKATLKADEKILTPAEQEFQAIEDKKGLTVIEYKKERNKTRLRTVGRALKLYGPALAIYCASLVLLVGGVKEQGDRLASAVAFGNATATAFQQYRDRTTSILGKDVDKALMSGNGIKEAVEKSTGTKYEAGGDPWRSYDNPIGPICIEYAPKNMSNDYKDGYHKSAIARLNYLRSWENRANKIVETEGYVEINDLLSRMGLKKRHEFDNLIIPKTPETVHPVDFGLGYLYNMYDENVNFKNAGDLNNMLDFVMVDDGHDAKRTWVINIDTKYVKHISEAIYI